MGIILAKFRKPKTSYELLENLEKNIKDIEEYSLSTQERQKRYVGNFLLISIGLYIIGFIIFYFAFFPPTWMERITYSIPLLIFPLLIFLMKRLVAWYFQIKLNKKSRELNKLRGEKKKIIEEVMEKETYKVAIEILNKFADKNNGLGSGIKSIGVITPRSKSNTIPPTSQQKQLLTPNFPVITATSSSMLSKFPALTPVKNTGFTTSSPLLQCNEENKGIVALNNTSLQVMKRRIPFPIVNKKEQSVLEKLVDYLIGDGPQNRFAMICIQCSGHNGMALEEDFEFRAFRCAFCNTLNPPRKYKPIAPKLESSPSPQTSMERKDSISSVSEKESEPDQDFDESLTDPKMLEQTEFEIINATENDTVSETTIEENNREETSSTIEKVIDQDETKTITTVTTEIVKQTDIINIQAVDDKKSSEAKKND